MRRTRQAIIALALLAPLGAPMFAQVATPSRPCTAQNDSQPTSLGAGGWAAVGAPVTGGCGAIPPKTYNVSNRSQLVNALFGGQIGPRPAEGMPDNTPKIIYINGTIDLNVDDNNRPLTEEDYMRMCNYTAHATFYDPVTRDQTGSGGFFGAYKAAYDPNRWIRQSLDNDNRPPALSGPLEEARLCFQQRQAERVMVRVGSNTSIIGRPGTDPRIVNGNLVLGFLNQNDVADPRNYRAENVVIRNITFQDAFDMFPSWDPKDSFSITITNTNGCQAAYDETANAGPHRCVFRGGRWNAEYDSISIMNAEDVWIDHNTFTDEPRLDTQFPPVFGAPFNEATQKVQHHDGQVDVTLGGTSVTISRNVFRKHDKVHLIGGSDRAGLVPGYGPGRLDVTLHHNYYQDTGQRMPRVRFGRVHVYNNYYDLDWRSTAEYRLGDTWILGTAAKLVTENNVLDIRNNSVVPASKIINYSSNQSNRQNCINAGFSEAECGTYYYDQGTVVTTIMPTGRNTQTLDIFAAALVRQQSSANNAPLIRIEPTDPSTFWYPTRTYDYELMPVGTADEQQALRQNVLDNAGADKLK
jgi:pectate lyase